MERMVDHMLPSEMSVSKLAWKLVPIYSEKISDRKVSDLIKTNRFVIPSEVPQRSYAKVESLFYDYFDEVDFVELSPLQPLGINHVLAKTDGKNAIPTIRGQEVISDATTALFMEAYNRYMDSTSNLKRLATHVRTVRPQIFNKESRFLPHFKVFAEVSVGRQTSPFGAREVATIATHLTDELTMLDTICSCLPNRVIGINAYISNQIFAREIARKLGDSIDSLHLMDSARKVWEDLKMPRHLSLDVDLISVLETLGFNKGLKITKMFLDELNGRGFNSRHVKFVFDLSRTEGINYYKHIAYKITAIRDDDLELPLADGGSNDWGTKMSHDKQIFTVSSGIGTELFIKNFLELA